MSHCLQALQLQKRFGQRQLWQIPALQLCSGQVVHLQGENGSGKTTLMKALAGLVPADSGRVLLDGKPIISGQGCCYLHQQPYMFDRSVAANLELVLAGQTLSSELKRYRLQEALHWSGLERQARQSARSLSGGERQRLAMARAWLSAPFFWLLDEPSANLDDRSVLQLVEQVTRLRAEGVGILMTAHQSSQLTEMCTQHWCLRGGKLYTESG